VKVKESTYCWCVYLWLGCVKGFLVILGCGSGDEKRI